MTERPEDKRAEQMDRLNREGVPWDLIGKRFNIPDAQARRIVREYRKRKGRS